MRQPCEKRLLAATGMMKPFHHEELAVKSVMGLIQEGAGCRHLRVFEDGIPTNGVSLLRLNSAIERGTKPDAWGWKPCHWTNTLNAAMVNARRA